MNLLFLFMTYILDMAGGGILDLGIYPIQLACMVFGGQQPISVSANGHLTDSGKYHSEMKLII